MVIIAVEKVKDKKISGLMIQQASQECFKPFFEEHIDSDNAKVFIEAWRIYATGKLI